MSENGAQQKKIAKRYGGVLFELSQERKNFKKIIKDIHLLCNYLQKARTEWAQIISPTLPRQAQQSLIETLTTSLELEPLLSRFLLILAKNRRLADLHAILEEFIAYSKKAEGIIEGILETVEPLIKKDINDLQKALKLNLGKNIHINQKVNTALLGGIVLRFESIMMDASLKTQLTQLRRAMER